MSYLQDWMKSVLRICLTWERIQGLFEDPAVLQDSGVMDGARIPRKGVNEAALPITHYLQLGGLDANMAAINSTHTLGQPHPVLQRRAA